jgi:hypothetical protein
LVAFASYLYSVDYKESKEARGTSVVELQQTGRFIVVHLRNSRGFPLDLLGTALRLAAADCGG